MMVNSCAKELSNPNHELVFRALIKGNLKQERMCINAIRYCVTLYLTVINNASFDILDCNGNIVV